MKTIQFLGYMIPVSPMVIANAAMASAVGYMLASSEAFVWAAATGAGVLIFGIVIDKARPANSAPAHHEPRNASLTDANDLPRTPLERSNRRLGVACAAMAVGMVGMAYAAVPLYAMFCSVTGYGGTPGRSDGNVKGVVARPMTVRFDSNVDASLNWTVKPAASVTGDIGTVDLVNFVATNTSDVPVTAMAVFNVTPQQVGYYFNKIECFCFSEQTLQPGETVNMPITFFIDPDLTANKELDTIKDVTLSYTFYKK